MTQKLKLAIVAALIIKIILAALFDTADSGAMNLASSLVVQGEEVYNHPQVDLSSPPLHLHVLGSLRYISDALSIPFTFFWKIPAIVADTGIAFFIFRILRKKYNYSKKKASSLTIWFVLNPISLYVSGFHGQSEAVWILFSLLSWYALSYRKKPVLAGLLAAVAVGYKLPAILLLPALTFTPKLLNQKIEFVMSFCFFFVMTLFPEIVTSRSGLMREVFMYKSAYGLWGITSLIQKIYQPLHAEIITQNIAKYLQLIILTSSLLFLTKKYLTKTYDFFVVSLYTIVVFLFFTPGFGIQYLFWPLPFLVITNNKLLKHYTFWVTFAFVHTYGISWWIFSKPITFLQRHFYYKTKMLYPYDLYFPVWLVLVRMLQTTFQIKPKP